MAYLDPIALDRWITREPDWYEGDEIDLCDQAAQLSDKLDELIVDAQLTDMELWTTTEQKRYAKLCRVAYKANRRWERRGGGRETEEDYDQIY